jgi:riboflavin biosynthesis pyrimidine reductase
MPDRLRVVLTRSPASHAGDSIPDHLEFTSAPPAQLVSDLSLRGIRHCAVLGGSQVHSLFLAAGMIDELWLTVEPLLFGGGTPLLAAPTQTRLRLMQHAPLSADTLLLKYEVLR